MNATSTLASRIASIRANGDRLALNSGKQSDDVNAMLGGCKKASPFELTASVNAQIDAWGIDTSVIFSDSINPKVTKRFIQFAHGISARDYKNIDCTTARIIFALQLAGEYKLTTDALAYMVCGRVKADAVSPNTRGVSTRALAKLFDRVGLTTAPTQISRSVGDNGFLTLTGAVFAPRGVQNREHAIDPHHSMVRAFFACINAASDAQLEDMTE